MEHQQPLGFVVLHEKSSPIRSRVEYGQQMSTRGGSEGGGASLVAAYSLK